MIASKDKPFTLLGFSKAELYKWADNGEKISGNVALVAGVATLVAPNPVTGAVVFGAKASQAAFAVGKVLLSKDPFNELIEVSFVFVAGKAGKVAAKPIISAIKKSGLAGAATKAAGAFLTRKVRIPLHYVSVKVMKMTNMNSRGSIIVLLEFMFYPMSNCASNPHIIFLFPIHNNIIILFMFLSIPLSCFSPFTLGVCAGTADKTCGPVRRKQASSSKGNRQRGS